ncbi:MAG TPA: FliH/SctL family protein [Planctomycetaceae bacterium]|jgi:flagellar assembly protein FliH|nr:FliH/SctL family protein [Planctomycetaceae bacterium]
MQPTEIPAQTRLLKANDVRGLGSKVVFNFDDLRQRGDEYVETVRKQVGEMLASAEAEVVTLRKSARQLGYEEGQRDGLRNAAETIEQRARQIAEKTAAEGLATALPALKTVAESIAVERDRWIADWEGTAVRLAAAIAGRLLGAELRLNPQLAKDLIRQALQLAVGAPRIRVHLHSDDAALLGTQATEIVRSLAACGEAEIVPDNSLTRGGCLIETQHGQIDGRIESILDRMVAELLESQDA